MSTDFEDILNLLFLAEEVFSTDRIPYETSVKYERTRKEVFNKVGVFYSPSKIWKLSGNDFRSKGQMDEVEWVELLGVSHETNLKYSRMIEDFFEFFENFKENLESVIDGKSIAGYPQTLKAQDLNESSFTDIHKFKELRIKELKRFEIYQTEFYKLIKDLNKILPALQDKFSPAQKTIHNLESQLSIFLYKAQQEKEESESRLQELLETCHSYSDQIDHLKAQLVEITEKKSFLRNSFELEKNSIYYMELVNRLENQIHDLNKDLAVRDKRIEKLTETVKDFEEKNLELEQNGEEHYKDQIFELEHKIRDLNRLLEAKNSDLEETLDNLRFLQDELALYKYRDGRKPDGKEAQELKNKYKELKSELNDYKSKANDYKEEALIYKNQCIEYKDENKSLKTLLDESKSLKLLKKLQDLIHELCAAYKNKEDDWKDSPTPDDYSQVFKELNFLASLIDKMAFDNNWLVDRLEELGQENHQLKQELGPSKTLETSFSAFKSPNSDAQSLDNNHLFTLSD